MKLSAAAVSLAVSLATPAAAAGAVKATFSTRPPFQQGTLKVESDANDAIVLTCGSGKVLVNGRPPDTGELGCGLPTSIDVKGGPGDNFIAFSGLAPAQSASVFRGVAAYASIEAGKGDDVVVGPTSGLIRFEGGPGDDLLEGRAIDRYVFRAAETPEVDTIVEYPYPHCSPSFFDSNQHGRSYWTVPWDALDFAALPADDPVTADSAMPAGVFASHRNRIVRLARSAGVAIEAVAGGAGDDAIAGFCMTVGGPGNDRLAGGKSGDIVLGGAGDDQLDGRDGPDTVNGGPGNDVLGGGQGADALAGMHGDDAHYGGPGGDVYLFAPGIRPESERVTEERATGLDVLSFAFPSDASVEVNLTARDVVATAPGLIVRMEPGASSRLEGVIGGAGSDRMLGDEGRNHFWSGGGNDVVAGGPGDDVYHVDWAGSMPYGAYGYFEEPWNAPFPRESHPRRATYGVPPEPSSVLRVDEKESGGVDTLDLAEVWLSGETVGSRMEGQVRGARVDLSAPRWPLLSRRVKVAWVRRGGGAQLERIRGTSYRDVLIGNDRANVLDGRHDRDLVIGRGGRDTCLNYRREDTFRGCEHVRSRDPDR